MALREMEQLSDWIKYLQIVRDIKIFFSLSEERIPEKRKETRFPLPEVYQKYIELRVKVKDTSLPVILINFSKKGLQFKCKEHLRLNSLLEFTVHFIRKVKKKVSFKARIKHCAKQKDGLVFGAQIVEISDSITFNFFKCVIDAILEVSADPPTFFKGSGF